MLPTNKGGHMVDDKVEVKNEQTDLREIKEILTRINGRKKNERKWATRSVQVSISVALVVGATGAVEWSHWLAISMASVGIVVFIWSYVSLYLPSQ
jgi:hypothetical protein